MVGYVSMCISTAISACARHNTYCTSTLNPILDRKHEIVATRRVFNCIEFGTIKIRIIKFFPFAKIFYCAFETHPSENNMLLHLAVCHICQRDIIFVLQANYRYFCIFNLYLSHNIRFLVITMCTSFGTAWHHHLQMVLYTSHSPNYQSQQEA